MTLSVIPFRLFVPVFLMIAVALAASRLAPVSAGPETPSSRSDRQTRNFDIRANITQGHLAALGAESATGERIASSSGDSERRFEAGRNPIRVERDPILGMPELIVPENPDGRLQEPSPLGRADRLRKYIAGRAGLYGAADETVGSLRVTADYRNPDGRLSFARLSQEIGGVPVFQSEVTGMFDAEGALVRVAGTLAAVDGRAPVFPDSDVSGSAARHSLPGTTAVESVRIYFPIAPGSVIPAVRVLFEGETGAEYVVVDARSGELLWRKDIRSHQTQQATYEVYGNQTSPMRTADSPTPSTPGCPDPTNCQRPAIIARTAFTLVGNEAPYTFNSNGWISDGETRTVGNAVEAGIDRDGTNGIDPDGWAFGGAGRSFVFAYNPAPGLPPPGEHPFPSPQTYPPSPFQQGSVTHAFYTANRWHDETYLLGFNEQARNFQTDNFGRGGVGNDPLSVEVQDGSGSNGANFATPADGGRGRGQLFVWTGPEPDRDGALDTQVAVHELTHGMSNRLHGNAAGLFSNMSRGMGEGWSDFYALALLAEPADDTCGTYAVGGYSTLLLAIGFEASSYYGIRRFPFARRGCLGPNGRPHSPLTFGYVNADCNSRIGTTSSNPNSAYPRGPIGSMTCDQVHNLGEIWAAALWEVRGFLIDRHGPSEGNRRALQYVTDGMKISPINPTMIQSRDAIIAAASASDLADAVPVWRGFAVRGLGLRASVQNAGSGSNNTVVTESFVTPHKTRADFDGDGRTDIGVYRPGDGIWYVDRSVSGFSAVKWGIGTDRIVPGDYDGDGRTDIAVFRATADPSAPDFYVLLSSSSTFRGFSWGLPGDVPAVEDYDGDGRDDFAVFRESNRTFYVCNGRTGSVLTYAGIAPGVPVAGDFDGDGRGDFAVFAGTGWHLAASGAGYPTAAFIPFGLPGDVPVPADYDGDGHDDFAVFRPADRTWYVRKSSGGVDFVQFGLAADIPAPADYDGDGRADATMYRNGDWFVNRSAAGILTTKFGLAGDIPLPAGYLAGAPQGGGLTPRKRSATIADFSEQ